MRIRTPILAAAALAASTLSIAIPTTASAQESYAADSVASARYIPGPPSGAIDFPEAGTYVPSYSGPAYGYYGYYAQTPAPVWDHGGYRRDRDWR